MTIIVFLIDTSASMNQRAYLGGRPTLLDVAKGAVETFVKVRQKSVESRGDRYMLLTFEEPPLNIKAGWKENLATFINELKNLQCFGMTTMGAALRHAFDVLNINRMQTGIDTYGQGRCPFYLEPSVIVVITDGGKLTSNGGVQEDFNLPMNCPIPGSELTREPFRWDQRLFSLVLRLSGTPAVERDSGLVPSDSSPIDAMCEVTGGRSYCITSHRMLMQCIDSLVQKVQSGVVISFEKFGADPPPIEGTGGPGSREDGTIDDTLINSNLGNDVDRTDGYMDNMCDNDKNGTRWNNGQTYAQGPAQSSTAWHSCRKLIYVPRTATQKGFAVGFWPIPESFRPDPNATSLTPRLAHPSVKFTCSSQEPMVIDNLPFDKYELEPSPLTQFILARKQPTVCWQVFVANISKNSDIGHPFGYLKASTNLTCVNLFVMPYNYPVLLPLLDDLFKVHRCKPSPEWKLMFQQYLDRMPSYYVTPLKRALTKMGAPCQLVQSLVPDSQEISLSYSVLTYLKRMKNQAKVEFDKLCNDVINKVAASTALVKGVESVRVNPRTPLKKDLTTHPCLQDKFTALRDQLNEFGGYVVGLSRSRYKTHAHTYRNPFDIQRRDLLDQVVRMRANFLQPSLALTKLVDDDSLHSMPIAQMGNYQDYLKRMTPQLREIESAPVRQHMFGNPFKIDKRMMVDEADIDLVGGGSGTGTRVGTKRPISPMVAGELGVGIMSRTLPKRKPGPLPSHFTARRPLTPTPPPPLPPPPPPQPKPVVVPFELSIGVYNRSPEVPSPWSHPTNGEVTSPTIENMIPAIPDLGSSGNMFSQIASYQPMPANLNSLPPVVKPMLNGDSYLSVGLKQPRSPSPPPPSGLPSYNISQPILPVFTMTDDQQERQISMILHEAVTGIKKNSHKPVPHQPPPLTRKEIGEIKRHNVNIRSQVYKAIRRPGKDFSELFTQLKMLRGGVIMKREVLHEVIEESLRFKRKGLSKLLQQFVATMEKNGNSLVPGSHVAKNDFRYELHNVNPPYAPQVNHHS
ncbi:integrator complex subunit 6 [Arctopsyche grandis]|uniref:integrator complex subunit 6 n=1 Tax=Arctopsyche grandis TaxID=121162 RepID=UPI00406D8664